MIVDASVAVKWLVPEDGTAIAETLIGRPRLIAPEFLMAEVGNALWKRRRRGESTGDGIELAGLANIFAQLVPTIELVDSALVLASRLDHSMYDCLYLALAERENVPIVTGDARFLAVCRAHGLGHRIVMLADIA